MEGGLTTYMKLENNEYHKVMLTFVSNVVQILCNLLGGGKGGVINRSQWEGGDKDRPKKDHIIS